jgi:predicted DNA-binding protein
VSLDIRLNDELSERLRQRAERQGVQPDELVQEIVREYLEAPDERFDRIAAYIVEKNRELYRRLS